MFILQKEISLNDCILADKNTGDLNAVVKELAQEYNLQ